MSNIETTGMSEIIRHIRDLPTLPEVAHELLADLSNDESSMDSMNEKIAMDQSITAKILRLANSSHFGTNSRVVTIQQATALLGVRNIKNVIRTSVMSRQFPVVNCPGFDFRSFWRHSTATAVCAELISRALHMKHDFAFTAGLLHDIGRLVLVTHNPSAYAQVIQTRAKLDCALIEAENSVLQTNHVEAGLALAQHWHFAEAVQDAIRGHHQPDLEDIHPLASVIHVANSMVHALDLNGQENDAVPLLSQQAWDTLALDEKECLSIFRETEMRCEALNQIFL